MNDPNVLQVGNNLVATATLPCPQCGQQVEIRIKLSIENLLTMSMVLWSHEELLPCPMCNMMLIPVIAAFDTRAIRWNLNPVLPVAKPLIEAPNIFDISKIKKQ